LNKLFKITLLFIGGLLCLCCGTNQSSDNKTLTDKQDATGSNSEIAGDSNVYRDIIYYEGRFFAIGTGGQIDQVSRAGIKTALNSPGFNNLNCATIFNEEIIIAGDKGTILSSKDGKVFSVEESGTDDDINGIASKNGLIVAGTDNGIVLVSKNSRSWSSIDTDAKGNIISLAANNSFFIGVSDKGEVIKSNDGFNWQVTDYNEVYAGYNKYCFFRKIIAGLNSIVIIGHHDDGSPSVLFSTLGNVWTERLLVYDDENGIMQYLSELPNDITYDPDRDQFILACKGGVIFSLPTCTKCNTYTKVTNGDLSAIAYKDNSLAVAGEDYSLKIIHL